MVGKEEEMGLRGNRKMVFLGSGGRGGEEDSQRPRLCGVGRDSGRRKQTARKHPTTTGCAADLVNMREKLRSQRFQPLALRLHLPRRQRRRSRSSLLLPGHHVPLRFHADRYIPGGAGLGALEALRELHAVASSKVVFAVSAQRLAGIGELGAGGSLASVFGGAPLGRCCWCPLGARGMLGGPKLTS